MAYKILVADKLAEEGLNFLKQSGVPFDVFCVRLYAASLEDIVRSNVAADRPQDRQDVDINREMLRRRGGPGSDITQV